MSICKLCNANECSVDAHIVPRWAYGEVLNDGPALVIPTSQDRYIGTSRKGEFDRNLVCLPCERLFTPSDTFGCQFFRDSDWSQVNFETLGTTARKEYFIKHLPGHDYDQLHKFVLSLLWRISATDREYYGGVKLGPREQVLGNLILEDRCPPDSFQFRLTRYFTPNDIPVLNPERILMNPQSTKISGHSITRIPLHGFEILVSADSRNNPNLIPELTATSESIPVLGMCFTGSPDIMAINQAIQNCK